MRFQATLRSILIRALLLIPGAAGATVCVNPGGTGGCFASIQAAVDAGGSSDTIAIAPGTYAESVTLVGIRRTIRGSGAQNTAIRGGIPLRQAARLTLSDLSVVGEHEIRTSAIVSAFAGVHGDPRRAATARAAPRAAAAARVARRASLVGASRSPWERRLKISLGTPMPSREP